MPSPITRPDWLSYVVVFSIFTNLYPAFFPSAIYFVGIALLALRMVWFRPSRSRYSGLYMALIGVVIFSSCLNLIFDGRAVIFIGVIMVTSPIMLSYGWHNYKLGVLRVLSMGYVVNLYINFVAYKIGYNESVIRRGVSDGGDVVHEFSGFSSSPMWLSALSALALIYSFNRMLRRGGGVWHKGFYLVTSMLSIFMITISASRSAMAISLVVCLAQMMLYARRMELLKYGCVILFLGVVTLPFYIDNASRMIGKMDYQEAVGHTSRDGLWNERIDEFHSSPIYGVGFAAHGVGVNKSTSRNESGGGWLAILAQTGIIGLGIVVAIVSRGYIPIAELREVSLDSLLNYSIFIFMVLHSIFEGYIFQGGWYMCVIFWLTLGVIVESKYFCTR